MICVALARLEWVLQFCVVKKYVLHCFIDNYEWVQKDCSAFQSKFDPQVGSLLNVVKIWNLRYTTELFWFNVVPGITHACFHTDLCTLQVGNFDGHFNDVNENFSLPMAVYTPRENAIGLKITDNHSIFWGLGSGYNLFISNSINTNSSPAMLVLAMSRVFTEGAFMTFSHGVIYLYGAKKWSKKSRS